MASLYHQVKWYIKTFESSKNKNNEEEVSKMSKFLNYKVLSMILNSKEENYIKSNRIYK